MYCQKCGKEINNNASFCENCGNPLAQKNDNNKSEKYKHQKFIISVISMVIIAIGILFFLFLISNVIETSYSYNKNKRTDVYLHY